MFNRMNDGVEYREISGFPGYRVGDDGSVWSRLTDGRRRSMSGGWHLLSPGREGDYSTYHLYANGKKTSRRGHRIVLEAFVGPKAPGQQCRHLNGLKSDNRLSNLCWGTAAEDHEDRRGHGTIPAGMGLPHTKLTTEDITVMRRLRATGSTYREVAEMFGITPGYAAAIVKRKKRGNCMRIVRTPNKWSCLACSFATIFGLSYDEMIEKIGDDGSRILRPDLPDPDCRQGHHIQQIIDVAEGLGYILTPFEARPCSGSNGSIHEIEFAEGNAFRFNSHLEGEVGVLIGLNLKNRFHAVVWDGSQIVDPANGQTYGPHLFQPQTFWRVLTKSHCSYHPPVQGKLD